MYNIAITYAVLSLALLGCFAYLTFKMTKKDKTIMNKHSEINDWLRNLQIREEDELKRDCKDKENDWTEEVIIPEAIYERFSKYEQRSWLCCDLRDIYSKKDIFEIFGVLPEHLNTCFSKRFYNLSKKELTEWANLGKTIDTQLPINDVLILYTQ